MDTTDQRQLKAVTKSVLLQLPIWDRVGEYSAAFSATIAEVNPYLARLEDRLRRTSQLLRLNNTGKPKPALRSPAENDLDIVLNYIKTNEGYVSQAARIPATTKNVQAKENGFKDESVILLSKKIECNEVVYAMENVDKPWVKCRVDCVYRRPERDSNNEAVIIFRLRLGDGDESKTIRVDKYAIARIQDHGPNLRVPKRVIAGPTPTTLMPGIIGQQPSCANDNRYLVLMDDGSASYFDPNQVYPILAQSAVPWFDSRRLGCRHEENEGCRRYFFANYPKRYIMKVDVGTTIEVLRNGILLAAEVIQKDSDILRLLYRDGSQENIYRGSPRLIKGRHSSILKCQMANASSIEQFYEPLLLNTYLYHRATKEALEDDIYQCMAGLQRTVCLTKNSQTARKSTASRRNIAFPGRKHVNLDSTNSETFDVVCEDWDSRKAEELKKHKCSPKCLEVQGVKTELSVRDIIDEFRHLSDLKVPLLLGWKRKIFKMAPAARGGHSKLIIGYEAPCGKIFDRPHILRNSLSRINSRLDIDYFCFDVDINLNPKLGSFNPIYYKQNFAVNSKTGQPLENKHISLFNQYNEEQLPSDFEYRNESFPHPMLKVKGFSFNTDFRSSCDCEDDCFSRASCVCHQLNEDSFGQKSYSRGSSNKKCQYRDKRLYEQVATGIFECNSGCKCSSKCSNRVVQNGIRYRLQVQKTINKGWGVLTLDDIPKGAFICTYAAEVLDDADQYGDSDMYYADLDFITANERFKLGTISDEEDEGVGPDSASDDEKTKTNNNDNGRKSTTRPDSDCSVSSPQNDAASSSSISSLDQNVDAQSDEPLVVKETVAERSRYPKRKVNQTKPAQPCSLSSTNNGRGPKQRGVFRSIHEILGSHDFTLDARMQGNVGRFFNHSCDPNATVQNVFIETHDLRFPHVAFFALKHIRALDEITWNYNYKMGEIEGRRIDCHCGAPNCRGRIL